MVYFPLERCEGEGQFPGEGQAEEREEQTRCEPLLRKEEASGRDWAAWEEETMGGEWWKLNTVYEMEARILSTVSALILSLWYQEYETTRKELEGAKKERDEAKRQLSALKQAQAPMLRKIQQIDTQMKPTDAQIKAKVKMQTL